MILSLFELSQWLRIPAKAIVALTKNENEPLPVYDADTLRFYKRDVREWLERWGLAAPNEDPSIRV